MLYAVDVQITDVEGQKKKYKNLEISIYYAMCRWECQEKMGTSWVGKGGMFKGKLSI